MRKHGPPARTTPRSMLDGREPRVIMQANELLPVLFHNKWDSTAHKWKSDRKDYVPTLADGYKLFDNSIRTVIENRKTNLTSLSITWEDPKLAKQWADGLVNATNDLL